MNPLVFDRLDKLLGPHEIDLFATAANRQSTTYYCSKGGTGEGSLGDAFQIDWNEFRICWCNPPWGLIPKILDTIEKCRLVRFSLVTPIIVNHSWLQVITKMCYMEPVVLTKSSDLFYDLELSVLE